MKARSRIIILGMYLLFQPSLCWPVQAVVEIRLTQKDKAQIIKYILIKKNLLERGLRIPEVREVIYLSLENISPELVPKIPKIQFNLLDPKDRKKWPKQGFTIFRFSAMEIQGNDIKISLTESWS